MRLFIVSRWRKWGFWTNGGKVDVYISEGGEEVEVSLRLGPGQKETPSGCRPGNVRMIPFFSSSTSDLGRMILVFARMCLRKGN